MMKKHIVLCILLGFLFLRSISAQENFNAYEIGNLYKSWDYAQAITESDDIIYLATRATGLLVIDAEHLDSLYVIGEYPYMSPSVSQLIVDNNFLYTADTIGTVSIFNVERPDSIYEIVSLNVRNRVTDMFVSDQIIYVACGRQGLNIIDVSDPANPSLEANWHDAAFVSGLDVQGDYAYTTDSLGALFSVDISEPHEPFTAGLFRYQTPFLSVGVDNDYAYILAINGLMIVDISDVDSMVAIGGVDRLEECRDIITSGNNVFFIGQEERSSRDKIFIIDVSNPSQPNVYSQLENYRHVQDIFLDRAHLYVAIGNDGLTVIDGFNFQEAGSFQLQHGGVVDAAVNGRLGYTANLDSGLCIFDISLPAQPRHLSCYPIQQTPAALDYQDETIYLLANDNRNNRGLLQIFNVSDSLSINQLAEFEFENNQRGVNDLFVEGRYSYITNSYREQYGLTVVEHFYNQNIHEVAFQSLYSDPVQIEVNRGIAYIAAGELLFIDVSDPTDPQEVYSYSTDSRVNAVTVHNNIAYLADGIDGLTILDVSDPEETDVIGHHSIEHNDGDIGAIDVLLDGYHLYLLDREQGLLVYNVRRPHTPDLIGKTSVRGIPQRLDISGNFAVVAEGFT
ncbi:MAG: hypothetical protein HQ568_02690 [Calditrichaeota bacterium]|nr:hypothetical protein [Calditrichota bacterium]